MKKVRTCRAIEANAGVRKAYVKALQRLHKDFQYFVLDQIMIGLNSANMLALDSLTSPSDREKIRELRHKVLANSYVGKPEQLHSAVDRLIQSNLTKWLALLKIASTKQVAKFVTSMIVSTSNAQRKSLLSAHFNKGFLKERWSVPIVKRQYVAPETFNLVQDAIKENVDLITKISANDVNRISDVLIKGLTEGKDSTQLKHELAITQGFDDRRIETVVRDQTNKLNQAVQTANAKSLGIQEAIWIHIPGKYTSRKTHIAMNGKRFDIDKGLYDSEVGAFVKPAECVNCRCTMRLIFNPEQVNDDEQE